MLARKWLSKAFLGDETLDIRHWTFVISLCCVVCRFAHVLVYAVRIISVVGECSIAKLSMEGLKMMDIR